MSYKIIYTNKSGYLHVHISGPESFEAALHFWKELAGKAKAEQINRFLIVDEVSGQLTLLEHHNLSLIIARDFFGKIIAYIDPKTETFENNKFGEDVVYNRGVIAKVFRNEAEGIEWLSEFLSGSEKPH